jgi:hypothetical protein
MSPFYSPNIHPLIKTSGETEVVWIGLPGQSFPTPSTGLIGGFELPRICGKDSGAEISDTRRRGLKDRDVCEVSKVYKVSMLMAHTHDHINRNGRK